MAYNSAPVMTNLGTTMIMDFIIVAATINANSTKSNFVGSIPGDLLLPDHGARLPRASGGSAEPAEHEG
jgi:hypothetical protein